MFTEEANEEALDAEMLVLLGILEGDGDSATHIVILIVDWQLHLILPSPNLMILHILSKVEFYIHLHSARYAPEERADLVLPYQICTMGFITK